MNDINVILADRPGLGRVRLCECNSIHLSIGPVTINLEPDAFAQAVRLMRDAMDQLEEIAGSMQADHSPFNTSKPRLNQLAH